MLPLLSALAPFAAIIGKIFGVVLLGIVYAMGEQKNADAEKGAMLNEVLDENKIRDDVRAMSRADLVAGLRDDAAPRD